MEAVHNNQAAHVSFRNVQKTYDGETLIVRDLNLDIRTANSSPCSGPRVRARRLA